MAGQKAKSSKAGRNRIKCERYRKQGRREINKARRKAARERWLARRQGSRPAT